MKTLSLIALGGLAALALAQESVDFHFTSRDKTLQVVARSGRFTTNLVRHESHVVAQGVPGHPVYASSQAQSLELFVENQLTVDVVSAPGQRDRSMIQSAVATGHVRAIRSGSGTSADERTEINGNGATYGVSAGAGRLQFGGPVTIASENANQRRTLNASGQSAVVTLDPIPISGRDPLRTAILDGNVHIKVVQAAAEGSAGGSYVADGDHLVLDNANHPKTLTLTGNIHVTSSGAADADVTGATKIVVTLNDQGEMESVEAIGEPTRTVYHPQRKGSSHP